MEEHTIIFYCHVHGLDKVLDYARCFHSVVSQYRMPRCSKKQNKGGGTTRKENFKLYPSFYPYSEGIFVYLRWLRW